MLMTCWTRFARTLILPLLAFATSTGAGSALAEKIVLQVSDGNPTTWNQALNVVGNLREAYGADAQIELVAFGQGINMLKFDAPVVSRLTEVQSKLGAKVYACENSMARNKLSRSDIAPDVIFVKAGVEHIISRQREGWVNIRP
jgi:intracellular sulfur oxidation DsrE/DsrF family protein